ncbi:MAG: xanthine dehydrogenase family protein [Treponema sp.]
MPKSKTKTNATKVAVQGEFYSDLVMDDMLYAAIVRSPIKKGIIKSISHNDLPDGYFLYTARDVPGSNLVETNFGKIPVFSEGNVSYKGEPLGILVGPDENKVNELLSEIEIIYDSNTIETYLKTFIDDYKRPALNLTTTENSEQAHSSSSEIDEITKALNLDADPFSPFGIVQEHEKTEKEKKETKENEAIQRELFLSEVAKRTIQNGPCFEKDNSTGVAPGIDSIFKESAFVSEGSWTYSLKTPIYSEPNGAICSFNGDYLTVYTPTQWLSDLRRVLSSVLNIDSEKIIVKKTKSNNRSTNNIWYNSILASQVAVASYRSNHNVKLVYTRNEQQEFMDTMLPITIVHKSGINKDGLLLAMQIDIDVEIGSSNSFIQEILDRLVIASIGCYNPKNIFITATAYRSSKPSSSIDLQLIDSASFFALENQINNLCIQSGFTPIELREKNIAQCSHIKQKTPFLISIEQPTEIFDAVLKQSDFNRKYASYHLDSVLRYSRNEKTTLGSLYEAPLRGIGLSCGYEGSGYFGSGIYSNDQAIEVTLEVDKTITIHCPPASASIKSIWQQLASSILKIPIASVRINSEFHINEEPLLPESIYSNISIMTMLLKKSCETILRKTSDSKIKLPLTIKKKFSSNQKQYWDKQNFCGRPFHSTSFASAIVEIELDPCTYREHIRGIWISINGGQILSVSAAENTIKLCIQKVLASLVEDENLICSNIHISFRQSKDNPTQIGELVYQVLPSAYTEALSQALCCSTDKLPLKCNSLYERLRYKIKHDEALEKAALVKNENKTVDKSLEKSIDKEDRDSSLQSKTEKEEEVSK